MEIHTLLKMPPFQGITEEELLSLILAPEHARRQYKPADFIACLLYTSPSPRDRQKSRMPSSA